MPAQASCSQPLVAPATCSENVRRSWLEIIRDRPVVAPKSAGRTGWNGLSKALAKEQQRTEKAFLATLSTDEATALRAWSSQAAELSRKLVENAARAALARVAPKAQHEEIVDSAIIAHLRDASLSSSTKQFDPGGESTKYLFLRFRLCGG